MVPDWEWDPIEPMLLMESVKSNLSHMQDQNKTNMVSVHYRMAVMETFKEREWMTDICEYTYTIILKFVLLAFISR